MAWQRMGWIGWGLLVIGGLLLAACTSTGANSGSISPTPAPAPPLPSGHDAYSALAEARHVCKATVVRFFQASDAAQQRHAARLPGLIDSKYQEGQHKIATILVNLNDPDSRALVEVLGADGSAPLLIQLFVSCQDCAPPGSVSRAGGGELPDA